MKSSVHGKEDQTHQNDCESQRDAIGRVCRHIFFSFLFLFSRGSSCGT
jgi:hypothetical protein